MNERGTANGCNRRAAESRLGVGRRRGEELFSLPLMVPLADDARALGMGKKARDNAIARNRFPVEIVSKGPFRGCRRTDLLRYLG